MLTEYLFFGNLFLKYVNEVSRNVHIRVCNELNKLARCVSLSGMLYGLFVQEKSGVGVGEVVHISCLRHTITSNKLNSLCTFLSISILPR